MNDRAQFPRASRVQTTDSFRSSTVSLLVVILLLTAWLVWFFGGTIRLHGLGTIRGLAHDSQIVAELPIEVLMQVQRGQSARLYLDSPIAPEQEVIPAVVTSLDYAPSSQTGRITLVPLRAVPAFDPTVDLTGEVQVDLEEISPAKLIMRSSH
ncbi:MAG: hypothetical protein AAF702_15835 [Chloroflexota bacterium]